MHNSSRFLEQTVNSIINQTFHSKEIILVDDHSTDDSLYIARKLQKANNNVLVIMNHDNGISNALNTGIRHSKGDFLAFIDHDDIALRERFQKQIDCFQRNPAVSVCGTWIQEFGNGTYVWKYPTSDAAIKALLLLHSPLAHPSLMVKRSVYAESKEFYDKKFDTAQDFEFYTRIFETNNFAVVPDVLTMYRIHTSNTSLLKQDNQYIAWNKAAKSLYLRIGLDLEDNGLKTIYNMKYPNFTRYYKENTEYVAKLIKKIIWGTKTNELFDTNSVKTLFEKKVQIWSG